MKKNPENSQNSEPRALVDNSKVLVIPRVKPPSDLTAEQQQVWQNLTNRMPADYFGAEHYPLMAQWCRHVVAARQIALLIAQESGREDVNIPVYLQLLKQQEIESRAITALSRTMRLTHQANIDPHTSRTPPVTVDASLLGWALAFRSGALCPQYERGVPNPRQMRTMRPLTRFPILKRVDSLLSPNK